MSATSCFSAFTVCLSVLCAVVHGAAPARPLADDVSQQDGSSVACNVDEDCVDTLTCLDGACYVRKNRYISVRPNQANAGLLTARRVSLATDTEPVVLGWIGEPQASVVHGSIASQWVSRVEATPFYADWSAYETVHLGDCEISPQHTYLIQAIELDASVAVEENYSGSLALPTADAWGDTVEAFVAVTFQDFVNIADIIAIVDGFVGHTASQTQPVAPLTWLDVEPEFPDSRVNMVDVHEVLRGFQGIRYPFRDPLDCPEAAPICGNGAMEGLEQCDDANTEPGDGCDEFCQTEGAFAATMRMVPRRASGVEGVDWYLEPDDNRIVINTGDQDVVVELLISVADSTDLAMFQATLDCSGFRTGSVGALEPIDRACLPEEYAEGFCMGVHGDREREPPPLVAWGAGVGICSTADTCDDGDTSGRFVCGGVNIWPLSVEASATYYAAQYVFHVPVDVDGSFEIGLDPDPAATVIRDIDGARVGPIMIVPALIDVSLSLCMRTSVFGDIVAPFSDSSSSQPDFTDIAAVVDCFAQGPDCPSDLRDRADLDPCVSSGNVCFGNGGLIDFSDISRAVDAFTGVGCMP